MKRLMIKSCIAALALVATVSNAVPAIASAQSDKSLLILSDLNVARQEGNNTITIQFDIDPSEVRPGRDREVQFTPVIRSLETADSILLPTVRIAGRNRYYSHLRNDDLPDDELIWEAGSKKTINYRSETQYLPWMERCRVVMLEDVANCCDAPVAAPETPLAELDFTPATYEPRYRFVALLSDSTIVRAAEGKAFVDFIVNRTEIRPTYRRNTVELAKIIASIDKVKNDPDAEITQVTIKGFASPEGSYLNNVRLAIGRTAALKEYVREHYNFAPEIMSTDYEPEDWAGLRAWVETCTLPHRQEILEVIDSPMEPDPKDHELRRRFPADYKIMLDSIYPALRHSDYTVRYKIRTFVDIDELKRVFASAPDRLRPVDFQRIASTYPTDSPEYKEVFLKAVEIYPYDQQANLNAANIEMQRGNLEAAAKHLTHAGDSPEAIYSRGVMAAINGDMPRAFRIFTTAEELGLDIAAEERQAIEDLNKRSSITYLVPEGQIRPTQKQTQIN